MKGWLFEGRSGAGTGVAHLVAERFKSRVEMFENVFASLFRIERLRRVDFDDNFGFTRAHDRLLRYFRRCITGDDYAFALPDIPVYLNEILASDDFCAALSRALDASTFASSHWMAFLRPAFPEYSAK